MGQAISRQRIYATLLALGACILLNLTIIMISQGTLEILAIWVSILLFVEMLIDLSCFLTTIPWWISKNRSKARVPLQLGAAAALFHALRVLVFVIGRVGPWINFDVRPEHQAAHSETWTWTGVKFAAVMAFLGVIGVIVIWVLIRRAKKN
jgi:hypothetical protein